MATHDAVFDNKAVPTSEGSLYTPASGYIGVGIRLYFFNTNSAEQTLIVYSKPSGGSSRTMLRAVLQQYDTASLDIPVVANGADIRGVTTTSSAVDCTISGYTRSTS